MGLGLHPLPSCPTLLPSLPFPSTPPSTSSLPPLHQFICCNVIVVVHLKIGSTLYYCNPVINPFLLLCNICIYTYTHTHLQTHAYIHTYIHTCKHTYIHPFTYIHTHKIHTEFIRSRMQLPIYHPEFQPPRQTDYICKYACLVCMYCIVLCWYVCMYVLCMHMHNCMHA